ncbi:hypothetical protein JOC54_000023 [Alkalihalobacillus xiaoxiensis]|uniref:Uncharacterized protein n=1 Tax=Shouchella xiaoxiensis TaxID=766895 RepID=A0ABS2SMR0_9BACI|nr:hypothetical protein [Shouchella xiaoxiensis]
MTLPIAIVVSTAIICLTAFVTIISVKSMDYKEKE